MYPSYDSLSSVLSFAVLPDRINLPRANTYSCCNTAPPISCSSASLGYLPYLPTNKRTCYTITTFIEVIPNKPKLPVSRPSLRPCHTSSLHPHLNPIYSVLDPRLPPLHPNSHSSPLLPLLQGVTKRSYYPQHLLDLDEDRRGKPFPQIITIKPKLSNIDSRSRGLWLLFQLLR
jgi:hypothetical protein